MKPSDLHRLLDEVLTTKNAERVEGALTSLLQDNATSKVLTIIANAGVHEIPKAYLHGEIYEASWGDWDASTEEALLLELSSILSRLAHKLRSKQWNKVYLIPTGHPVLSLQIKAMVYRLLRINTIDLYYKAGSYFTVDLDQRAIALGEEESPSE